MRNIVFSKSIQINPGNGESDFDPGIVTLKYAENKYNFVSPDPRFGP